MIDKHEDLAKASKNLCLKEPFFGLYLMMLNKEWNSNKVPTMGVSKNGINYQLTLNEDFWNSLTPEWKLGLIKHELEHISFFHLERQNEFSNQKIANWAMDFEINLYIQDDWLPSFNLSKEEYDKLYDPIIEKLQEDYKAGTLTKEQFKKETYKIPPRGMYIKDFPELKLEPRMGTRYYYDKLMEAKDKKEKSKASGANGGKGTSGCPSADDMLEQLEREEETVFDHGTWKDFQDLTEAEKKLLRVQTDFHLKEIADQIIKSRGTIPGELAGYIDGLDKKEPPKFDWKGYLRNFIGGSTRTYVRKTRRKQSKRFEGSPGQRVLTQRHVLLGVDTSGSVSNEELKEFLGEMYHINKTGTEITVVQFDSAISNISKFNKFSKDKYKIFGRGGTDFNAFCDYYNENHRKVCCAVIFTDGEAPPPENKPRGKVLWVHSSKSNINQELPGYRIKLN